MADTFDDLAALAAKAEPAWNGTEYAKPNGGLGLLVRTHGVWSYPGAPQDGVNLRLPTDNIPDTRVQAALAAGAWGTYRVDGRGRPDIVVAAGSAMSKQNAAPLQPTDIGTAQSVDSSQANVAISLGRGAPPADLATFKGRWQAAFATGLTPLPDGRNLEGRHLVFRIVPPVYGWQPVPAVGDQIRFAEGTRYRISSVSTEADGGYSFVLGRLN